ncbi:MAG: hypothetical protein R3C09_06745 [Pirellulaceae bacterium]
MTLPSRKKHPTIAPSIRHWGISTNSATGERQPPKRLSQRARLRRTALATALAAILSGVLPHTTSGQQPQWRPSRIPDNSHAQPLHTAAPMPQSHSQWLAQPQIQEQLQQSSQPTGNAGEPLGPRVTLRWKTVSSTAASEQAVAQSTRLRQQASQEFAQAASSSAAQASPRAQIASNNGNPLRSPVIQAAYQQLPSDDGSANSLADGQAPPALPPSGSPLPNLPNNHSFAPPQFDQPQTIPPTTSPAPSNGPQSPAIDPLEIPELPPPPTATQPSEAGEDNSSSILEDNRPANPFPPQRDNANSPSDADNETELIPPPRNLDDQDKSGELKRRNENANSGYCHEMRSRIHANPITNVSLDISPKYGAGFRAKQDTEEQRLDFAASAVVREWTDYRGYVVAKGRLINLRDDRVVIDVEGREQLIPIRDLSDVDVTYVGESWNIPERCGTGYDRLRGRNFVPATVQWAASGLCHKPLYFEQVQLERYGHETGPVLQPLISSAHFFGNIAVLPYKMGIHPPAECQYALGYFRPGNCAPYMVGPIPWSLRGAVAQAAVVTGGAALIP